jgi:hypothetical protein
LPTPTGAWTRRNEALAILLNADRDAPEQIRHHHISQHLTELAKRLHVT